MIASSTSDPLAHESAFESSRRGEPIGIVAGWGRYPLLLAEHLRHRGHRVCGVGIADHADQGFEDNCDEHTSLGLTRLGAQARFFRRHGVRRAVFAGKIHKIRLFQRGYLWNNLPDYACFRAFLPHFLTGRKRRNDDALLAAATEGFARLGVQIVSAIDFAPELLVPDGHLCGPAPTAAQSRDIDYGWSLAKAMGGLDIGQTVAVRGQAVLAVEAIEGTDECIRRAGQLCGTGGFTVVKVAKPNQDLRFDLPAIGVGTVQTIWQAGGKVLAVEAGRTILVDRDATLAFANRHGITIVAR